MVGAEVARLSRGPAPTRPGPLDTPLEQCVDSQNFSESGLFSGLGVATIDAVFEAKEKEGRVTLSRAGG